MNLYEMIRRMSWFVMAAACMCIGLDAAGMNVAGILHINGTMDMTLRYFVGGCGVGSLVDLVVMGSGCCKK